MSERREVTLRGMDFIKACRPLREQTEGFHFVGWAQNRHSQYATYRVYYEKLPPEQKSTATDSFIASEEERYLAFFDACRAGKFPLFSRKPGERTDVLSHDEIRGRARLSWMRKDGVAEELLQELERRDWEVNDLDGSARGFRWWVKRMTDFEPAMRAYARAPHISVFNQILWSVVAVAKACGRSASGQKMTYLDCEPMNQPEYPWAQIGVSLFALIMQWRYPMGPQQLERAYYHKDSDWPGKSAENALHPFGVYGPSRFLDPKA